MFLSNFIFPNMIWPIKLYLPSYCSVFLRVSKSLFLYLILFAETTEEKRKGLGYIPFKFEIWRVYRRFSWTKTVRNWIDSQQNFLFFVIVLTYINHFYCSLFLSQLNLPFLFLTFFISTEFLSSSLISFPC